MSYCRFSNADVYVFMHVGGFLSCCGCWLAGKPFQTDAFGDTQGMLKHLDDHRAAGHNVPQHVYDDLLEDAPMNDEWMAKVATGMCPDCEDSKLCNYCHGTGLLGQPSDPINGVQRDCYCDEGKCGTCG